jgi:hypothetical protein
MYAEYFLNENMLHILSKIPFKNPPIQFVIFILLFSSLLMVNFNNV